LERIAIYPATFDPVTNGHLDIIQRAAQLYDKLIVAVFDSPALKNVVFSLPQRAAMIEQAVHDVGLDGRVVVSGYSVLTVEFARHVGAQVMIRGIRSNTDYDWEFQLARVNHQLAPDIETVCLIASAANSYVSSTIVKDVARMGGDVSSLVPAHVEAALRRAYGHEFV
jgi:pantetheine-phosphate adenylyltransferase